MTPLTPEDEKKIVDDALAAARGLSERAALNAQIKPLEDELNRLMEFPSANRWRIAELRKQLEPLWKARDGR